LWKIKGMFGLWLNVPHLTLGTKVRQSVAIEVTNQTCLKFGMLYAVKTILSVMPMVGLSRISLCLFESLELEDVKLR
jgi:hypothetical protein